MIGILGGMGTQAGLDFCNKLAKLNKGKTDQQYPLFVLYNTNNGYCWSVLPLFNFANLLQKSRPA